MANESKDGNSISGGEEQVSDSVRANNLGVVAVRRAGGPGDKRLQCQDMAVRYMLRSLLGNSLQGTALRVLMCDLPVASMEIGMDALAEVEVSAYNHAGYPDRAEGLGHFEQIFRGYEEHGPETLSIVEEIDDGESNAKPKPLSFGDYFEVWDYFEQLGEPYASTAQQWLDDNPGLQPNCFIFSKYVTVPGAPSAGLYGLGGRMLAAALQGLRSTNEDGILVAARTQPNSQRLIRVVLPRQVSGLDVILGAERADQRSRDPVEMLAYVPFVRMDGPDDVPEQ